jgi:hypothetical protein
MVSRSSVLLGLLLFAGCQSSPKQGFERAAVQRCLPPDVSLDDVMEAYSPVDRFTVEDELIDLGAHVDKDGKLRDAKGNEIRFIHEAQGEGASPPGAGCTVVVIPANPAAIRSPQ